MIAVQSVILAALLVAAIALNRAAARTAERKRCAKIAASACVVAVSPSAFCCGYNAACSRIAAEIAATPKKGGAA